MGPFAQRYIGLIGVTMSLFVTFVACGSQLYKVSLKNDSGPRSAVNGQAPSGALMSSGPADNTNPASPNYAIHAPDGWVSIPIHYRFDSSMSPSQIALIQKAMATWETATGRTLFTYDGVQSGVTGDSFPDLFSSLDDPINGLYLDTNWGKTGKEDVVLATTIWDNAGADIYKMQTADMHYNNQDYTFADSMVAGPDGNREVVDLQTVATHELGHFLGLNHVDPAIDAESIMVPSLYIGRGITQRTVSEGDITRIQKIYGCAGSACNVAATKALIAQKVREPDTSSGAISAGLGDTSGVSLSSEKLPAAN